MTDMPFKFGWLKQSLDHRDLLFSAPLATLQALPPKVDLKAQYPQLFPDVYDQGRIGSCTANAIAGAVQFERRKLGDTPDFVPSRLFIYYNERDIEGSIPSDAGAYLRDGMKSVANLGVCPESDWTYDDTPADPNTNLFPSGAKETQRPDQNARKVAEMYAASSYLNITQSLAQMKGCLASGYPFVFGFSIYASAFGAGNSPKTVFPLPLSGEEPIGGHAVLAVGYNDDDQLFKLRNSWGPNVQEQGYFYMPYAYLMDPGFSSDFWTLRGMSQ